ncbi:MAG: toll/interleukin-1 receptor domain-containing protein [Burkholderiaceae bacterium]
MAYIPGYDNDVFVSYAHADDCCLSGEKIGWVTRLVKQFLAPCIDMRLGSRGALKLWMDHELEAGHPITPQLVNQVRRTAVLVVILSPSYINSPWCKHERENYLDVIRDWESRRVFVIEPGEICLEDRPQELRDLKSFRFWAPSDHEGGAPCPLGTTRDLEDEFKKRVFDVSYAIAAELRRICWERQGTSDSGRISVAEASDHPQALLATPKQTVFLAQVTDDLHPRQENVRHYLEQQGVRVVPDDLYWWEPESFRQVVARDLEHADLFVQLLGTFSPRRPKGLPEGYMQCELDLARAAGKRILRWRDPRLDPAMAEDADHRAFLEAGGVIAEPLEDFKKAILKALTPPQVVPIPRTNVQVFVARDQADQPLAEEICSMLEHCDAGWSRSLLDEKGQDPQVYRQDMEDRIKECDAIIVVYGRATPLWVRRQLGLLGKKLAEFNKRAAALAVFDGPPEPKLDVEAKPIPYMNIVKCRNGVCEDEIRRFLDETRRVQRELAGVA